MVRTKWERALLLVALVLSLGWYGRVLSNTLILEGAFGVSSAYFYPDFPRVVFDSLRWTPLIGIMALAAFIFIILTTTLVPYFLVRFAVRWTMRGENS